MEQLPGHNELQINTSTMKRAIQYWLNKVVLQESVEITAIKQNQGTPGTFTISFSEQENK